MKLQEIIALSMAGYKKKDIDELIAHENDNTVSDGTDVVIEPDGAVADNTGVQQNVAEVVTQPDEPDYKLLYENAQAELEKAQKHNVNANVGNNQIQQPDVHEILTSIIR